MGWTYNADIEIIDRIVADYVTVTSPIVPNNPGFVSVNTNISFNNKTLRANFSSVLTVNLLELNKQNIKNISCGDLSEEDTQLVDVVDYFTPNVTASYQYGILSRIEVQLVS